MPEIHPGPLESPGNENRLKRAYWSAVLNTAIPNHARLRNGENPDLRPINLATQWPVMAQPKPKPAETDESDGFIRTTEGKRYDYHYYQSTSDLNMPSCMPDCKRYPDEHCLPTYTGFPLFLTISSMIQVIMFIYFYTSPHCFHYPATIYCPAQRAVALTDRQGQDIWNYDIWRLWTYQFAHAGLSHLVPNVVMQIIFGSFLEVVHGPLRVGTLYTTGVIFGGCFSLILKPHMSLVGASAGVYALITAVLANTVLNWSELNLINRIIRLFVAGGYLTADIGSIIMTGSQSNVSYIAHLGGALVGALLGLVILKNWDVKKNEVRCQVISFLVFMLVLISVAVLMLVGDLTHRTLF